MTSRDSHATDIDIDKNKNREDIDKSREDIKPEENLPPQMNDENLKRTVIHAREGIPNSEPAQI